MTYLALALLAAAAPLAAGSAVVGEDAGHGVSREYRCGPGDVLSVNVFEVEELSGSFVVGSGGDLRLPLIGPVPVAGETTQQIERRLSKLYGANLLNDPRGIAAGRGWQLNSALPTASKAV